MATATKSSKVAIKVRLADGIVSRKASPVKNANGYWKAKVTVKGKDINVYRKSGRGIKTYELEENLSTRELLLARG